jgi:DNA segregation ATPase FtsK/SpoIIIE-like protein
MGFEGATILNVVKDGDVIKANVRLPSHADLDDLEQIMNNLKMELNCLDVKIGEVIGKKVELLFGNRDLSDVPFEKKYINDGSLKISLPNSFGVQYLDFEDGASCHLLNGGAPRMGKTIFLLYLSTMLYVQTNGNIKLFINSPKSKDFYPLFGLPNIQVEREESFIIESLDMMIDEYKKRNTLLYSPAFKKATDAKTVREFYPKQFHLFKPMFLIIDEYGRFAENRDIQMKVMELVETAGFVNVHVVIATQRPDARTVLPPRIKQGLQARICFRVPDKNNSIVILDNEGAEKLPTTKGRAIMLDGDMNIIQVPYLKYHQCEELLKPFRKEMEEDDCNQSEERPTNHALANKVQNLFTESVGGNGVQGEHESDKCLQSGDEKNVSGWFRLASPKDKG